MKANPEISSLLINIADLQAELDWLRKIVDTRLRLYFRAESPYTDIAQILPPNLRDSDGAYARCVRKHELGFAERLVLITALAPHLRPEVLDGFFARNKTYDRVFSEFGGVRGSVHAGFLPTGETAMFLLAGSDLSRRLLMEYLFDLDFVFRKERLLWLEAAAPHEPQWSGRLVVAPEFVAQFTTGRMPEPDYSPDFPARRVRTQLEWQDVILPPHTRVQVQEIQDWIRFGPALMNGMGLGKRLSPGFKALFYGPPGTGKTLTASLIGKTTDHPVYKVDLSMLVSKYIGETEKNLGKVFDLAESRRWILFFDEADSLFGKRTEVSSSNDRYANQETAYLLQRIETFDGVVILASNLKDNIDAAFSRRFQAVIPFPMPEKVQRHQLWQASFSPETPLEEQIDLEEVADKYLLSGGAMMNVVRYCTVKAVKRGDAVIRKPDLDRAIRKELEKEGMMWL
ncbi:MAG: ATP-binding protein [Bacteroidota bacterium]